MIESEFQANKMFGKRFTDLNVDEKKEYFRTMKKRARSKIKKQIQILCIEEGSVDMDLLKDEGLKDGGVLVYKQGSQPPFVLTIDLQEHNGRIYTVRMGEYFKGEEK